MPRIELKNISKTFPGGVCALTNFDLVIEDGEFVCVLGPSGCGKSTLIGLLGCLDQMTTGEAYVGEKRVTSPTREIGIMFQDSALLPWRTVLNNVAYGLEVAGVKKSERLEMAMNAIKQVDLTGFENNYPHQLSGGMQQRAGIARTLVTNPSILLMDEPFGALDHLTRLALQNDLVRIWQNDRKTVLFVTHDVSEAVFLADRVVVLTPRPGQISRIFNVSANRPRKRDIPELKEVEVSIYDELRRQGYDVTQDAELSI